MDTYKGDTESPASLHKYLYASGNPVNRKDPSGQDDLPEIMESNAIDEDLTAEETEVKNTARKKVEEELEPEILIHSTSQSNAYSINTIGLTAQQYPELDVPLGTRVIDEFNQGRWAIFEVPR